MFGIPLQFGCCRGVALSLASFHDVALRSLCRRRVAQPPFGPRRRSGVENFGKKDSSRYAHSLSLGRSTAGDLLNAELVQLGLQLIELLGELLLVLAPELTSLDLGRLYKSISDKFSQ